MSGRYPSKFQNLTVPGTKKISEFGYRWLPGIEKISEVGYRWVPGTKEKNFGYRRVPARYKIVSSNEYRVPARKNFWVPTKFQFMPTPVQVVQEKIIIKLIQAR